MKAIAAETLVARLIDWGVDTIFGLPGDGINGLFEALRRHQDKLRFVLVHHEEAAAFMACAYAKTTGRLGVCIATSGPGGIHLLNGLYDAKLDHQPVLAITGMQETSLLGTGYQQEVHLERVFQDVAEYSVMISNPRHVASLVDMAVRTSLARRGVSHITFPNDIQGAPADADPYEHVTPARPPATAAVFLPAPGRPREEDLRRLADVLGAGEKVAILAGAGALHARAELLAVADLLGAPIVKTLSGKACVPDDSPFTTGGLGLLGTRPSEQLMQEIDTLLMVGTNYPFTKHLPEPGSVRVVQIESDPVRAGNRMPTEAPVIGDAKEALAALAPLLTRKLDRSFLESCQAKMEGWRVQMSALENVDRDPIAPQYLMSVVDRQATSDAILTCDSGTIATWAARHWTIRDGREFYLSGNLASMAPGLPYAIAAGLAHPGRQVIAFVGDGGFAMLMAEFLTAVRHRVPIKVIINNNGSYGQILWEQMALGFPEFGTRHDSVADYAPWARSCGAFGVKVTAAGDLDQAVRDALAYDGPALVDCNVDPDEPPMPGLLTSEQVKGFSEAFLRGQPHKAGIVKAVLADTVERLRS
ncbi:MAG: thiamine pyrophosphate-dependent enzyme [Geodermatophilaceae bacterium]